MIRAAAKNYENTVCICSSSQYDELTNILRNNCSTDISIRKKLAVEAFKKSSDYDSKIFSYMNEKDNVRDLRLSLIHI